VIEVYSIKIDLAYRVEIYEENKEKKKVKELTVEFVFRTLASLSQVISRFKNHKILMIYYIY